MRPFRTVVVGLVLALPALHVLPAAAAPPATLQSNQTWSGSFDSAFMGSDVASAGDVNGDGYDDVVVGAFGYDAPGGVFDEGAAFVFLGSAAGVVGTGPASAHAAIVGSAASGELGTSVDGVGDVNRDGYDDIVVGAPRENADGLAASGAAYLFLGGPAGITATSPAQAHARVTSQQIQGFMGQAVAGAGDVNADGFDDVVVGAGLYGKPFDPPLQDQGSGGTGASFVFLGGPGGLVGRNPATAHARILPWLIAPGQILTGMGQAVDGAGDVNRDGYADLVVGAPGFDKSPNWPGTAADPSKEGAVYLFHGGPGGIANPTTPDRRIEGSQLQSGFGNAVAGAGDVDADGYADLVVGASRAPAGDPLLLAQEGAAYVFHGGPGGVAATAAQQARTTFRGSLTGEWLGRSVAGVGDVDGDGYGDVAVGAGRFPGSIPEDGVFNGSPHLGGEGVAYVFRGSATGVVGGSLAGAYRRVTSGQEGGTAGFSVAGADPDRDGRADLLVGSPGWADGHLREGAVFVNGAGPTSPPPPPPPPNQTPTAHAGPDRVVSDSDGDGLAVVTYDGSASTDADGSVVGWSWSVVGGSPLGNTRSFAVQQAVGTYQVQLTVTDDRGGTATDTVQVVVRPPTAPTASASVTLSAPTSVRRGAGVTWTGTVTNRGLTPVAGALATLSVGPTGSVRDLRPAAAVSVPTLAAGATTALSWTARADRVGGATATVVVRLGASQLASATRNLTITR